VAICYATGLRVGCLLELTRADIIVSPDGRIWLRVKEKARADRRLVDLRGSSPGLRARWLALADGQSLWTTGSLQLTYARARAALSRACGAVGVERFTLHALRHAFASDVAVHLGLDGAMRAGGWKTERTVQRYVHHRHGDVS
jgi:integrase